MHGFPVTWSSEESLGKNRVGKTVPPTAEGSKPSEQPFHGDSLPSCCVSPKRMHRRVSGCFSELRHKQLLLNPQEELSSFNDGKCLPRVAASIWRHYCTVLRSGIKVP